MFGTRLSHSRYQLAQYGILQIGAVHQTRGLSLHKLLSFLHQNRRTRAPDKMQ